MSTPKIFDTCRPRSDILKGGLTDSEFAADLAKVILKEGSADYIKHKLPIDRGLSANYRIAVPNACTDEK